MQVASLAGQQIFQGVAGGKAGQQYLIVNQAGLHSSGGRIQIVTDRAGVEGTVGAGEAVLRAGPGEAVLDAVRRREILARQPSYCKVI